MRTLAILIICVAVEVLTIKTLIWGARAIPDAWKAKIKKQIDELMDGQGMPWP